MNRITIAMAFSIAAAASARAEVVLVKTPGAGIQPQAVIDARGTVHLLYFTGERKAGNLQYARREPGNPRFSAPLKVNSQDGSAIAVGSIRGGQLALGKNGRVHVAWNGSMKAEPKNPIAGTPMLYARLADDGKSFEPQRNLMTKSAILDGGGTLTADAQGNVYVAWHALDEKLEKGEQNRKVWVTLSSDDGKTFAAEKRAWSENTGACACCGMRGFIDLKGNAYFLYRAASEKVNRGMYVLKSVDVGKSFAGIQLDNWKIDSCPLSSEAIAEGQNAVIGAWENDGQIYFRRIHRTTPGGDEVFIAPGKGGDRRHPALAFNKNGEMILAWTEGTAWNRGGGLAWQVYDKAGNPTASAGRRPGAIPVWGVPTVVAEPNGDFTIFH
jgi:hypothetical protein